MKSTSATLLFTLSASAFPNILPDFLFARQTKAGCDAPVYLNASTNVWKERTLHVNSIYSGLVAAAIPNLPDDKVMRYRAERLKDKTGTFVTIEGPGQISTVEEMAKEVPCNAILGLLISGLPWKKCPGPNDAPFPANEPYDYAKEFIDPIVKIIKAHPNTAFALVIEPGVLGPVVRNANEGTVVRDASDVKCLPVRTSYQRNVPYALKALSLPNVILYLDTEHGGVLGWKDVLPFATKEIVNTWTNAEKPAQFRGLALNIKGYNGWDLSPGESFKEDFPATCYDLYNRARNEKRYLELLERDLVKAKMPAFGIMDTSRNRVTGIRKYWTDWCNVNGHVPSVTPNTKPNTDKLDAYVWAKWPGVSDGTSDKSSPNFVPACVNESSYQPMPERGQWSQPYFEYILKEWGLGGTPPNSLAERELDEEQLEAREAFLPEIDERLLKRCDRMKAR